MRYVALIVIACVCLAGCARQTQNARINDVAVATENDTGYRLVAVDGVPPKRDSSNITTVVPFALVDVGPHTFTLEGPRGRITVKANVQSGKTYRIAEEEGALVLIEDPVYRQSPE